MTIHRGTVVKIIITLILAGLYVWVVNAKGMTDGRCEGLKAWYDAYNETYFEGSLPKDVLLDYSGDNSYDSLTTVTANRFHIKFSPGRVPSPIYAHLLLLHEACHIKTWPEVAEHGPQWVACMETLEHNGAFHHELINQFSERK